MTAVNSKGGGDETGPYDVVANWPQNYCGDGFVIGATAGILAESPDRVFIFSRGCLPTLQDTRTPAENFIPQRNAANFDLSQAQASNHPRWDHIVNIVDRNGRLIESWEQHNKLFIRPHRVQINPYDPERHIWLVDDGAHSIYKFTNDGKKLVMTLGEFKVPGNDERHFGRPTEIAWLPDGTFFVSDGYTNTRVVKFDRNGKFLLACGMKGNEPIETRPGYMSPPPLLGPHVGRSAPVDRRRKHTKDPEVRPEPPAPLLVGHVRSVPRWLPGRATVQRGQRGQPLYGRCARRARTEVPPQAWRHPRLVGAPVPLATRKR